MTRKRLIVVCVVSLLAVIAPQLSVHCAQGQSPTPGGKGAAIGDHSGTVRQAARAQASAGAESFGGVYSGTYHCGQGTTNLKLSLVTMARGEVSGLFTFYLPAGTQDQSYTYSVQGQFDAAIGKFKLAPVRWETAHPGGFAMVGLDGNFVSNQLSGTITGPGCTTFNLIRDAVESANTASGMGQGHGATRRTPPGSAPSPPAALQSANQSHAAQAPAGPQSTKNPPEAKSANQSNFEAAQRAARELASTLHKIDNPSLVWELITKGTAAPGRPAGQPTAHALIGTGQTVQVTASCGLNGISVFFVMDSYSSVHTPTFNWYKDNSTTNGDPVVDVRVSADTAGSHVAKGYPDFKQQEQRYSNSMGIFFYAPGAISQASHSRQMASRTGGPLDGIVGPYIRRAADAEAQQAANDSAGRVADLLNARTIRIELPIKNLTTGPSVDLNPQDAVIHKYVTDCDSHYVHNLP
jgi:hypothetical protein